MTRRIGYAEIANIYRRKILDGELRPGDDLPPISRIQADFEVSVTTANRAYQVLKQEGFTVVRPGVGTVVARRPQISSSGVARAERLSRTGHEFVDGETSSHHEARLLSCRDPEFAELLGVEVDDEVVVRHRIFRQDGKPSVTALSLIHMRAFAVVPEVAQQGQLKPFWHETYEERTGKRITASPERRYARHATDGELADLEIFVPITAAVPVLVLRTVWHDEDGPIEVWEDVHAPGTWQIANE
jgi:DNA-binding GntR family transcriptional regulator